MAIDGVEEDSDFVDLKDLAEYEIRLQTKVENIAITLYNLKIFGKNVENVASVFEKIEIFRSPPFQYRARCRFAFGTIDGEPHYLLYEKGQPTRIADNFPQACESIIRLMPLVLESIKDSRLCDGLRAIHFLGTCSTNGGPCSAISSQLLDPACTTSNQSVHPDAIAANQTACGQDNANCVVALIYDRPLAADFVEQAHALRVALGHRAHILGRAKGVAAAVDRDYVLQQIRLADGRTLTYKHREGAFSNPNPYVNAATVNWLCSCADDIEAFEATNRAATTAKTPMETPTSCPLLAHAQPPFQTLAGAAGRAPLHPESVGHGSLIARGDAPDAVGTAGRGEGAGDVDSSRNGAERSLSTGSRQSLEQTDDGWRGGGGMTAPTDIDTAEDRSRAQGGLLGQDLLELYCGGGNHTCALAPRFRRVVAVEIDARLCAAAAENLAANGVGNAHVLRCPSARFCTDILRRRRLRLPTRGGHVVATAHDDKSSLAPCDGPLPMQHAPTHAPLASRRRAPAAPVAPAAEAGPAAKAEESASCVVEGLGDCDDADGEQVEQDGMEEVELNCLLVDPPRAGLDAVTARLAGRFRHVLYVSCNPAALSRDLGPDRLGRSHEAVRFAVLDHFPGTAHLECAVYLRAR